MAALFKKKNPPTLTTQLEQKAATLHAKKESDAAQAASFAGLAADAKHSSAVAGDHARAVEQALGILTDAGVR